MESGRTPQQVAKRALICGALAARASFERSDHPRAIALTTRLLPWLEEMSCADELDPIERRELETPRGKLSDSEKIDVNWAGEAAALYSWMLQLAQPLDGLRCADQSKLPGLLKILKPEGADFVRSALLRPRGEIESAYRHFVLIQSIMRESRIDRSGAEIIRRVSLQKLLDVGIQVTAEAINIASEAVGRMTAEDRRRMAGAYFIRVHAASWFFSDRDKYYA